jgi:hypothetical protein
MMRGKGRGCPSTRSLSATASVASCSHGSDTYGEHKALQNGQLASSVEGRCSMTILRWALRAQDIDEKTQGHACRWPTSAEGGAYRGLHYLKIDP